MAASLSQQDLDLLISSLKGSGFKGDIESSYAERIVASTDNSIYQVTPKAILYPQHPDDINRALKCINLYRHQGASVCFRGGATGTNGQSLSDGLIVDCSRYLNKITDFNLQNLTVTVQPGVVLDQLNDFLKQYDLFFPIDISSSSRATLGGMVATDASGKGSLIYGKTSRHIYSLNLVLYDGTDYLAQKMQIKDLADENAFNNDALLPICNQLDNNKEEINRVFPKMDRGLTGYNLQQALNDKGEFNPCYLIAGSEGTLAATKEVTLKVIPRPKHKILTVIFYEDFYQGLEHTQILLKSKPTAIEMLDDKIISMAKTDSVWHQVKSILGKQSEHTTIGAVNYVECFADSEDKIKEHQYKLQQILDESASTYSVILSKTEDNPDKITALWSVRKRAVGLLGKMGANKQGTAFVEDSAVPPKNLSSYVHGFKTILDKYNLDYGIYGHADAGVLHIRPGLNLTRSNDQHLIRKISDQVANLSKQNGGVLWGEHGRGYRGEYTPLFFGDTLYPLLCNIKSYFDPYNLLNPGKLVTPDSKQAVIPLDEVTFRGNLDSQIQTKLAINYTDVLSCNGNGACHNWQPDDVMCPSFKSSRNKIYSPKGRASLLREWIRLKSTSNTNQIESLEQSLFKSLEQCLSCKSCTATCPLKVDIPELKFRFLHSYHQSHPRNLSDFFLHHFENLISIGCTFPRFSNALLFSTLTKNTVERITKLKDLPHFSTQPCNRFPIWDTNKNNISEKSVIILQDNYMTSFDKRTLISSCHLLERLGYDVYLSEVIHNGKLSHVKGYRSQFKEQTKKVIRQIELLQASGFPIISTETIMRLMFIHEYPAILDKNISFSILSIESFLRTALQQTKHVIKQPVKSITLLPHCSEQTISTESSQNWEAVFNILGISMTVINAGCCGMSGLFGHEAKNQTLSSDIFNLRWNPILKNTTGTILASGYSCRCQLKNYQYQSVHPAEYLLSIF